MFLHHWRSGLWKEEEYALPHFCPGSMSSSPRLLTHRLRGTVNGGEIWSYNGVKQMCLKYREAEKGRESRGKSEGEHWHTVC